VVVVEVVVVVVIVVVVVVVALVDELRPPSRLTLYRPTAFS
jgi:hypothetical protein